jgi:hypothetical protein
MIVVIAKTGDVPARGSGKVHPTLGVAPHERKDAPALRPLNSRLRKWSGAISVLCVGLMTMLLFGLQAWLIQYDGHRLIRPYAIGYLVPIILLTALAGRGAGLFTLLLSCLATAFFLAQPYFSYHIASERTQVELWLLLTVGLSAIFTVGAGREKAMMLADISGTTEGDSVLRQVRQTAEAVSGVRLLQGCTLRRRGVDLYVDVDVVVDQDLPQHEARDITDAVERAIRHANPLVFSVRVRAR